MNESTQTRAPASLDEPQKHARRNYFIFCGITAVLLCIAVVIGSLLVAS